MKNIKLNPKTTRNQINYYKMEILKSNEQAVEIVLTPQDVEAAVKQFIYTRDNRYYDEWILTPKYNLGEIVIAGTKK